MRKSVPWMMVAGRAALGPVVLVGERCGWSGVALAGMVLAALLSDIFDGVLARRWRTDTAALRLADSLADTAFYVCVAGAICFGMPAVWHECRGGVLFLLACEAVRFGFDLVKFGKPASYHSYLAKTWGLVLAVAVIATFATQRVSGWMGAAIVLGVLSNLETMAMSMVLPVWKRDVKTLALAWRIRVGLLRDRVQVKKPAGAVLGLAVVPVLLLGGAVRGAQAQALKDVVYVGGTALQGNGLHGHVDVTSPDTLVFAGAATLAIPYDHVISYEAASRRKVHVGLLTEGVWRLVAPWPEAKELSVSYRDADEHKQVVVLEMSRGDEALLVEVLKTRVPRSVPQPMLAPRVPVQAAHVRTEVENVPVPRLGSAR